MRLPALEGISAPSRFDPNVSCFPSLVLTSGWHRKGRLPIGVPSHEQVCTRLTAKGFCKKLWDTHKTLLDALVPAVDQLEQALNASVDVPTALAQAAAVAREHAEATRGLIAKRGRAAYTGERSIGTLDAGAVGVAVMFERVSEAWG